MLIINKKGNSGFMVSGWTMPYDSTTKSVAIPDITDSRFRLETSLVIEEVKVHSCGKKVMKLHSVETGSKMKGCFFDPAEEIFETQEQAFNAAVTHLKKINEKFRDNYKRQIQKDLDQDWSFLNEVGLKSRAIRLDRIRAFERIVDTVGLDLRIFSRTQINEILARSN
jgi:hypothetical protein